MRTACVQFQPDRAGADERRVREAWANALPDARLDSGDDDGRPRGAGESAG
jgi:hypothetical protein